MTPGIAVLLLGAGLALWPVAGTGERRLAGLRALARLRPAAAGSTEDTPHRPGAGRTRVVPLALLAVVASLALVLGPALAVAAGAALAAVAVVVAGVRADRRAEAVRRGLATGLAVLAGELGAGTAFPDALRAARTRAGPAAAAFDPAGLDGAGGRSPSAGAAAAHPDVVDAHRVLLAGSGLVATAGAPWAGVAAGIERDVAGRAARAREVSAAVAGARASTLLLAALPVLGVGLAAGLGATPLDFLLGTPAGRVVLAGSSVLELLGVAAGAALARRAAR